MTPGAILGQPKTEQRIWHSCYDGGWQGLITPESFAHPAKFSFALIKRIYEYMLSQGYVQPGQIILDPFGGMGGGAVANFYGLNWVGCELEKRFTDLGQGCDCTGISKADWVRFYGRWDKMAHKDGRHWCPQCLAQAKQVTIDQGQLSFFEPEPSAAYTRNSGIIPETRPHHYAGNLELFRKYAQPGTFAVLLNGDSRNLRRVIGQAVDDGLLGSPPYAGSRIVQEGGNDAVNIRRQSASGRYGMTEGQLGGMSEGNLVDSLLSSPPYINSVNQSAQANDTEARIERMKQAGIDVTNRANVGGGNGVARQPQAYGDSDGQLGAMKEGELNGLLSSPPFAGNTGGRGEASRNGIDAALFDRHSGGMKRGTGDDPANLDHLPMKGFDSVVGSPPFSPDQPCASQTRAKKDYHAFTRGDGTKRDHEMRSGENLDGLPMVGFDAALSSPPFADSVGSDDPDKRGGLFRDEKRRRDRNLTGTYGVTDGQLGAMPNGGLVSSPPYEGSIDHAPGNKKWTGDKPGNIKQAEYGTTVGQLGTEQGQTFWAAAKMIVSEAWLCLKPGSYSAWVCKKFVRNGQIVDFPGQWQQLCEACGFEYVETVRAMLVSPENQQGDLDGGSKVLRKERKSFFRRLAEKNGSPRIDFEEVVILRKPLG